MNLMHPFNFQGAFGIVWFVLWTIFSTDSPDQNRFISKREKEYILEETKEIVEAHHKGHNVIYNHTYFSLKMDIE